MSHVLLPKNLLKTLALFRIGTADFSKLDADAFPTPTDAEDQGAILDVTDTGDRYIWTGSAWFQTHVGGKLLVSDIDTLAAVVANTVQLASNETSNDAALATNTAQLASNEASNDTALATNTAQLVTNKTSNDTKLDTVATKLDANKTANDLALATNTAQLATNKTSNDDKLDTNTAVLNAIETILSRRAKTVFGELRVANLSPIVQMSAVYATTGKVDLFVGVSGTAAAEAPFFTCSSGTNLTGFGSVVSKRQIAYRAGQGLLARLTAIFDTPATGNKQRAGLFANTDSLNFGFNGTVFGIFHEHSGVSEIQTLTITTAATGGENATVTVDGTGFTVALTSGSLQHNAFEIAESLNSQVALYDFSSNDDTVVARSLLAGPGGSFAFTSSTAIAAWNQDSLGVVVTEDFVAQTNWNVDTASSLDPSKGNVYQIQLQWLGFGAISFFIENAADCTMVLVHVIEYCNSHTVPSLTNPTLRLGWASANNGISTTDVTVKGSSAAGFVEGQIRRTEDTRSRHEEASVSGSEVNILTIRSRLVFGNRRNRVETFLDHLSIATESTKRTVITIYSNATIAGDVDWQYVDEDDSIIEYAIENAAVSGGRLIDVIILSGVGSKEDQARSLLPILIPGETYTIAAEIVGGGGSAAVAIGLTWQEDI